MESGDQMTNKIQQCKDEKEVLGSRVCLAYRVYWWKEKLYCKLCRKSLQLKFWPISKHETSLEHGNRVKESK